MLPLLPASPSLLSHSLLVFLFLLRHPPLVLCLCSRGLVTQKHEQMPQRIAIATPDARSQAAACVRESVYAPSNSLSARVPQLQLDDQLRKRGAQSVSRGLINCSLSLTASSDRVTRKALSPSHPLQWLPLLPAISRCLSPRDFTFDGRFSSRRLLNHWRQST